MASSTATSTNNGSPANSFSNIPSLPPGACPDPNLGLGAGGWIYEYINYSRAISPMTPRSFHESAALWLPSVVIARRLVLNLPHGRIYPNLYILWNAASTLFRKSTALKIPQDIISDNFPFLLAAQNITPEALLSDMAGKEPTFFEKMTPLEQDEWRKERNYCAQRGLILDEISGLLTSMGRDYNAGLMETFLLFYDCQRSLKRSTRAQGRLEIRNAYLSLLSASTPSSLSRFLQHDQLWSNGFWPRFAILTPDDDRPAWQEAHETNSFTNLADKLKDLHARLPAAIWPDFPNPISVSLGSGVKLAWDTYNKAVSYDVLTPDLDNRLHAAYGRLPTHVLKVAMILAALDWTNSNVPKIEMPHLVRAIEITESWRSSVHRALSYVTDKAYERFRNRILALITKNNPNGITLRDICRGMRDMKGEDVMRGINDLLISGDIEKNPIPPGAKGGRSSEKYTLAP